MMARFARLQRPLRRLSLRSAVVLALVLGLAVPTLWVGWAQISTARDHATLRLQEELMVMTEIMAVAMHDPLWQISPESGRRLARAMLSDSRVSAVRVTTSGGKPFVDVYRSVNALAPNLTELRPVMHNGVEIGAVQISFSTAPLQALIDQRRADTLWRLFVGLLASLLLVLWVIDRWLLKPLNQIAAAAERLPERHLDQVIELPRDDELGRLAKTLNSTRLALRDAFDQLERRNLQLKSYADTLETRVEQRTEDLTETNDRLSRTLMNLRSAQKTLIESEKLASLGRLVAGIAHEMNTPLGNSVTVVSELEDRYRAFREQVSHGGIKRSEFDHFLDQSEAGMGLLRRNVDRATVLITHFKQVAIDQSTERRRSFDLAQVIEETLSTLQHRFKRTPYNIQTEMADGLMMDSYPGPLEQCIIKLVENSLAHGFVGRSYGTVTVRAERLGRQRVRLVVRDDGIGMDALTLQHIFDPFFGTHSSADDQGGAGLGMSIVHSIVTGVLGGRVDVQSRPGEGAACIIDLPAEAPLFRPASALPATS